MPVDRAPDDILPGACATPSPVCSRHALRTARLARRALRLTAGVNPAYLCPSAGLLMSPGAPVRWENVFPVYLCDTDLGVPQKNPEIPSFDTTVRRRPDRSRPPQVGPKGHTCTESAAPTASAKHSNPCNLPQSDIASAAHFVCTLPPACRSSEAARRKQGGAGGIISPACLSCLSYLYSGKTSGNSALSRASSSCIQAKKAPTLGVRAASARQAAV